MTASAHRPIKAVLFDKDGTLIDFHKTWAPTFYELITEVAGGDEELMVRLARPCGYHLEDRLFAPTSIMVAGSNEEFALIWAEMLGIADHVGFLREVDQSLGRLSLPHLSPFNDLHTVLDRLMELRLPLGVATNDAEASARGQLRAMGIETRFTGILGYDSGHGAKPEPGMIRALCTAIGAMPAEVVMVGDSLHDIAAGRAAGTRTVALTTGTVGASVLAPAADHVADSLTAGLAWIEGRLAAA